MRITKLFIKEYKNLQNFTWELDAHDPVAVIVGKNGSGKTNLLEAIILIFDFLYSYGQKGNRKIFDFELGYRLDDTNYLLTCENQRVEIDKGNIYDLEFDLPDYIFIYYGGLADRFARLMRPYNLAYGRKLREGHIDDRKFVDLPTAHYRFVLLAWLMGSIDKGFLQEKNGINPANFSASISIIRPSKVESDGIEDVWGVPTYLRNIVVGLKNINVNNVEFIGTSEIHIKLTPITDPEDLSNLGYELGIFEGLCALHFAGMLKNLTLSVEKNGVHGLIPFEYLSEGEIQRIGIRGILEIFRGEEVLFLLDEPDTFAHPRWQWEFVPDIYDAMTIKGDDEQAEEMKEYAQTIFVTHSPIVVSSLVKPAYIMENGEIRRMNKTFGNSINETLAEQEIPYREKNISGKLKKYIVMIQDGEAKSKEAIELRASLENALGANHQELQDADDLISLYE